MKPLANDLLARLCAESGQSVPDMSPRALAWLQQLLKLPRQPMQLTRAIAGGWQPETP